MVIGARSRTGTSAWSPVRHAPDRAGSAPRRPRL